MIPNIHPLDIPPRSGKLSFPLFLYFTFLGDIMNNMERNAAFGDLNDLLDAQMDDFDDLPSYAVPPTGNYTLGMTIEKDQKDGKEFLSQKLTVIGINSVKDEEEASEVKEGNMFTNSLYTMKNDGSVNKVGIAAFITGLRPFAIHFFGEGSNPRTSEVLEKCVDVTFTANLKRKQRKDRNGDIMEDSYNFQLSDIIIL
jgi:hypothetical protein